MTHTPLDEKDAAGMAGSGLSARVSAALFLFALVLRVPMLSVRRMAEGDGVHYATLARDILAGDLSGLANAYWSNLWPGVIAATAWLTGLDVVLAGRTASLVAGSLLAPATAALACQVLGRRTGLIAGFLVAIHPWLIHFSTLVFTESFFALLLVMTLLSAVKRQAVRFDQRVLYPSRPTNAIEGQVHTKTTSSARLRPWPDRWSWESHRRCGRPISVRNHRPSP